MPALPEVGLVGINEAGSWSFPASVGDGSSSDPPLNRSLAHPQRPGNLAALHPLLLQCQDVFIPSRSFALTGLLRLLDGLRLGRTPFLCTTQLGKRLGELHRDTSDQILDQMPAVAHLPRLWSALTNSRSIFRGAISADHLKRGMLLQPGFDAVGRAVRQQINGPTLLQVTDQRPVTQSAFVCPIIQTNHARGRWRRLFPQTNQTQDGIATPADAELASGVGSCLAADSESKLTEGCLQPCGALSVRTTELWESFSENLLSTGALFTEKTTYMQDETDGTPNGGEISQCAFC